MNIYIRDKKGRFIVGNKMFGPANPFYGKKHSLQTREKIRKLKKGKPLSEETKSNIRKAHLERLAKNGFINTPESRKKLSETRKRLVLNLTKRSKE